MADIAREIEAEVAVEISNCDQVTGNLDISLDNLDKELGALDKDLNDVTLYESGGGVEGLNSLLDSSDLLAIQSTHSVDNPWEDPSFPASPVSLGPLFGDSAASATSEVNSIHWVRPAEICKSAGLGPPTFAAIQDEFGSVEGEGESSMFELSDLKQGGLGDCWYIAALQALINRPGLLERVIPADNAMGFAQGSYCGVFHFQFYDMETCKWVQVLVDDRLPCKLKDGVYNLAFAKYSSKYFGTTIAEFWPPLIEKAFAKFVGSYAMIEGGYMSQAFCNFTGGFDELFYMATNSVDIWKSKIEACLGSGGLVGISTYPIDKACSKGQEVLVGYSNYKKAKDPVTGQWIGGWTRVGYKRNPDTLAPEPDSSTKGYGLLGPHAYTVVGIRQLRTKDGSSSHTLLQVRNPHAAHEWGGVFGDEDEAGWAEMEEDLRNRDLSGSRVLDNGVFWIDLPNAAQYFELIEFCYPDGVGEAKQLSWVCSEWPASLQNSAAPIINISDNTKRELSAAELSSFPAFKLLAGEYGAEMSTSTLAITLVLNGCNSLLWPLPFFRFWVHKASEAEGAALYSQSLLVGSSPGREGRDASLLLTDIEEPGSYIVTAGLQTGPDSLPDEMKGKPIKFTLRVFSKAGATIEVLTPTTNSTALITPTPI